MSHFSRTPMWAIPFKDPSRGSKNGRWFYAILIAILTSSAAIAQTAIISTTNDTAIDASEITGYCESDSASDLDLTLSASSVSISTTNDPELWLWWESGDSDCVGNLPTSDTAILVKDLNEGDAPLDDARLDIPEDLEDDALTLTTFTVVDEVSACEGNTVDTLRTLCIGVDEATATTGAGEIESDEFYAAVVFTIDTDIPDTPVLSGAVGANQSVTLSLSAVDDATEYIVRYGEAAALGDDCQSWDSEDYNESSFDDANDVTVQGLDNETTYAFCAFAEDAVDNRSPASAIVQAQPIDEFGFSEIFEGEVEGGCQQFGGINQTWLWCLLMFLVSVAQKQRHVIQRVFSSTLTRSALPILALILCCTLSSSSQAKNRVDILLGNYTPTIADGIETGSGSTFADIYGANNLRYSVRARYELSQREWFHIDAFGGLGFWRARGFERDPDALTTAGNTQASLFILPLQAGFVAQAQLFDTISIPINPLIFASLDYSLWRAYSGDNVDRFEDDSKTEGASFNLRYGAALEIPFDVIFAAPRSATGLNRVSASVGVETIDTIGNGGFDFSATWYQFGLSFQFAPTN